MTPDLFTQAHKGLRSALFAAVTALGRAGDDPILATLARDRLREALHFVAHHGDNEDRLLLPLLQMRAPDAFAVISRQHRDLDDARASLLAGVDTTPTPMLYRQAAVFVARYLDHLAEEEDVLEPRIRAALTTDEIVAFGQQSVARTAPADQRMMLGWMLPAMTPTDAAAFLDRLPPPLADALRPLV
jgi:hypothetical protein